MAKNVICFVAMVVLLSTTDAVRDLDKLCKDMIPEGVRGAPQTSPPPYEITTDITTSPECYTPGQPVTGNYLNCKVLNCKARLFKSSKYNLISRSMK